MGKLLDERRAATDARFRELKANLAEAEDRCRDRACVYAIGSFARGEASPNSDLDLFIVGQGTPTNRQLSYLDEICVKADLIEVSRQFRIPDFSGDGEYLKHYTVDEFVRILGTPEDDVTNTFTARLLLLLESRALLEDTVYSKVIQQVIAAYWRDFEKHKTDFSPAFLANDILRMWRTFCVNYEARTQTDPAEKRAKRKLKNYKLKHSRLLTCYSGLLYLLAVHSQKGTVTPDDAVAMVKLTPTQRLEWLLKQDKIKVPSELIGQLIERYERFLDSTNRPESELVKIFLDGGSEQALLTKAAPEFGNLMYQVLRAMGNDNQLYRVLVV